MTDEELELMIKEAEADKEMQLMEEETKRKENEDLSVYEAVNPNDFESEEPEMFSANAPLDYDALKSQKMPKVIEDKKKELSNVIEHQSGVMISSSNNFFDFKFMVKEDSFKAASQFLLNEINNLSFLFLIFLFLEIRIKLALSKSEISFKK